MVGAKWTSVLSSLSLSDTRVHTGQTYLQPSTFPGFGLVLWKVDGPGAGRGRSRPDPPGAPMSPQSGCGFYYPDGESSMSNTSRKLGLFGETANTSGRPEHRVQGQGGRRGSRGGKHRPEVGAWKAWGLLCGWGLLRSLDRRQCSGGRWREGCRDLSGHTSIGMEGDNVDNVQDTSECGPSNDPFCPRRLCRE